MSSHAPAQAAGAKMPIVAIAGNPNTGKTTLFNRLTGSDHKVGNYPGVTVERHSGRLRLPSGRQVELVDVPGTYSLSARSREEEIAIQVVAGLAPQEPPDLVVLVLDATQLSRNLYMALQVIELGVPLVIALNMADRLATTGQEIDDAVLARELGAPVVRTSASKGSGLDALRAEIERTLAQPARGRPGAHWKPESASLLADLAVIERVLPSTWTRSSPERSRALALWALVSLEERDELVGIPPDLRLAVSERRRLASSAGRQIDSEIIEGRYAWIDSRMPSLLRARRRAGPSPSERADAILLNPWIGFPIFLFAMGIVFMALFSWAEPVMRAIEGGFDGLSDLVRGAMSPGLVRDFVTDALFGGVGSVVVFLPQILLLFLFIGILEDTGYMARVACLMDRLMRALGLHGRAFVPMLSGYACAVPAILATRTMERQRDRTLTMMVIPLMTCSARLPVYTLVIGALFPPTRLFGIAPVQGLLMVAMYLFSTIVALIAAAVLSRTLFKSKPVPLILEMPPYRTPHWASVIRLMFQRARAFLFGAGTMILGCAVVLWLCLTFPKDARVEAQRAHVQSDVAALNLPAGEQSAEIARRENDLDGQALRASLAGRMGHGMEPAIKPLGFDWKIGIGLIGAFAAREVFVSTMGVVYGTGKKSNEESVTLRARIREETRDDGRPVYTPLVGLSLMVFFALACQCMSTLSAVYRETKSRTWVVFLFAYMTALAWIASFAVYQGGQLLGFAG